VDWLGLVFFAVIAVFAAPILAVVALARAGRAEEKVDALRREVGELQRKLELRGTARAPAREQPEVVVSPELAAPAVASEPIVATVAAPPNPPRIETPPPMREVEWQEAEQPKTSTWADVSASLERMVAANWLVWLGAAALALGGVFLVRFAWEQGYFGPEARTIAATIAGAAMIGLSEGLRRRIPAGAAGEVGRAPLAVAAAGVVTLYGAAYAAGPLYQLVSTGMTLAGYVLASAIAVGLAIRHGVFLAMLGLAGGFAAPLLAGGGTPEPVMLLAYAAAVALAGLVLVRAFDWKPVMWVALTGAGVWMVLGAAMVGQPNGSVAVTGYALALLLAATGLAWSDADRFVTVKLAPEAPAGAYPTQTVVAAYGFWILAGLGLLAAFAATRYGARDPAMLALAAYGVAGVLAGWRKPAFLWLPLFGAAAFLATLMIAPLDTGIAQDPLNGPGPATWRFIVFAWLGAAITGLVGWLAMRNMGPGKTLMAVVSAFTPLAILIVAFNQLGGFQQHVGWGLGGGGLALLSLAALEGLRRSAGGLDAAKGAGAAYALGAFAASMFGVGASLGEMWMTVLFAAHLPAIAIIDRRFDLAALKLSASIAALVVMARVLAPPEILSYRVSAMPVLNELTVLYGATLLCFWGAARVFERTLKSAGSTLVQALDVGAIVLLTVLAGVQIRHAATGGDLAAGDTGLVEIGGYAVVFIALALGLGARLGDMTRPWPRLAVTAIYWLAAAFAVIGLGLAHNPLLRWSGEALDGPPLINLMAASYLPAAVLFGVHAVLSRRRGVTWAAQLSGFIALALAFLYVTLEVRNAFQSEMSLQVAPVGEAESYSYSIAWLLFAVAILVVGLVRKQVAIRHAAMAVLALSVAKVFLIDMSALTGVLRAVSFMGLGLALILIAYLYQKLVFRSGEA